MKASTLAHIAAYTDLFQRTGQLKGRTFFGETKGTAKAMRAAKKRRKINAKRPK